MSNIPLFVHIINAATQMRKLSIIDVHSISDDDDRKITFEATDGSLHTFDDIDRKILVGAAYCVTSNKSGHLTQDIVYPYDDDSKYYITDDDHKPCAPENIVSLLEKTGVVGISSIDDFGNITFEYRDELEHPFPRYNRVDVFKAISKYLNISFSVLIDFLHYLNPNVTPYAYIIETLDYRDEVKPYFLDDHYSSCAWSLTLPPNPSCEFLADIIQRYFIGIGGYISHKGKKIIFFMRKGYNCREDGYDYSHCVSHEIDSELIKEGYYHPKTVGKYLTECIEHYSEEKSQCVLEYIPEEIFNQWKQTKDNSLIEKYLSSNEPYPLNTSTVKKNGKCTEKEEIYITELFCGLQGLYNVPFKTQVAACAIVAKVSYEEMLIKLDKSSGKN